MLAVCASCVDPSGPPDPAPQASQAGGAALGAVAMGTEALSVGCVAVTSGGRDYLFCADERSWSDAQSDCRAQGMELARVNSASEDALLASRMFAESWLGGTDAVSEGVWKWPDGAQFWMGAASGQSVGGRYTNWASSQPDNFNTTSHCLSKRFGGEARWDDRTCSGRLDYVCERMTDLCPSDPNKMAPGTCGCGAADIDSDEDGLLDCEDSAPSCAPASAGGRDYLFCVNDLSWSAAQVQCRAEGMELVRIDGATEDVMLATRSSEDSWIGANDIGTEGRWVWSNNNDRFWNGQASGTAVSGRYGNWASGQPDNFSGTSDCGSKRSGSDTRWDDRTCSTTLHSICERFTDLCPSDPNKMSPGVCGCGVADADGDGDGTPNCLDPAPDCADISYAGHDYQFCRTERTWQAAQNDCRARQMDLARVDDAGEDAFLASEALAESWIGGSDVATESRWIWPSGVQFWMGGANGDAVGSLYHNWASNQPDDFGGTSDCQSKRFGSDTRWDDRTCTSLLDYVCERSCAGSGQSETLCNGIDDDCDGAVDEEYVATSSSCGQGGCAATGQRTCVAGTVQDSCQPGAPAATDASCDGVDDNCNGLLDEGYNPSATQCGSGACASTGMRSCVNGAVVDNCQPGTATADTNCNAIDDDCDTRSDEGFVALPSSCGTGACASTGSSVCIAGMVQDTCQAGAPAADDASCDGIDSDCDGVVDEQYLETTTQCGAGACAATGRLRCAMGAVVDDCQAGTAAPDDDCDAIDDDCDGSDDEEYVAQPTACGAGACRGVGSTSCVAGTVVDGCSPADDCEGLCDDEVDEDGDGASDCADDDCSEQPACVLGTACSADTDCAELAAALAACSRASEASLVASARSAAVPPIPTGPVAHSVANASRTSIVRLPATVTALATIPVCSATRMGLAFQTATRAPRRSALGRVSACPPERALYAKARMRVATASTTTVAARSTRTS
jgi:hypothetical protein